MESSSLLNFSMAIESKLGMKEGDGVDERVEATSYSQIKNRFCE